MPGKYNPFRPDKILPPGSFVGRVDELKMIDHCFLQTKYGNPQHFLIEGERGIGKSSLMLCETFVAQGKIKPLLSEDKISFLTISISLQDEDDDVSILRKISDGLKRETSKRDKLKSLAFGAWDVLSRIEGAGFRLRDAKTPVQQELFSVVENDIASVIENFDDSIDGIFLNIDEADKAPDFANLGLICKLLTESLSRRGLDKLCIGLAGLPGLVNKLRASHESSPRIFQTLMLQPLESEESRLVLERGLGEALKTNKFDVSITSDASKYICGISEGYPHFLQEFAYSAFEADTNNEIDIDDVIASLFQENGAFDQLGRKYFDQYYAAPDSDDYRHVLHTMADHSDSWVSRATLIAETGFKGGTIDNALRALKSKNIIIQSEMKSGLYKLPTKSFAIWLKAKSDKKAEADSKALF